MILNRQTSRFRNLLGVAALAALGLLTGACTEEPPTVSEVDDRSPRSGGTAVLGSISDVDSWNEYTSQQSFAGNLLRRIYLRLAQDQGRGIGDPTNFGPMLAESWESAEDGLSLTFVLREARWSDGHPLTADDVRFTWRAQTHDDVPWIGVASKSRITDVEVLGARQVRFHFDAKYPYQLADAVEGGIIPEHVFGKVPFDEWVTYDWSQHSVGSGPFVLKRHSPQHEIVLERNPHYYEDGLPLLDRVVVRVVPDVLALMTLLESGEIDWIDGIPPRDAHRIANGSGSLLSVVPFDYPNYDFIGWNENRPPLDSPELRRALTLAIDRDALVEDLLFGYGSVSRTPVPSSWWGADKSIDALPYRPDEARAILTGLGYATVEDDGTRRTGLPLRVEILTNNGNRMRRDMLVKIQEQLARVGVEVELRPMEPKAMRQQVVASQFDGFLGGWVFVGRVDLAPLFGADHVPPKGLNVVHYRSAKIDRYLDDLGRAEDARAMATPLREIQRQLVEDQPYTLLYETQRIAAHGPRLRGVVVDIPSDPLNRLERFWVATP
jgi:peptide/nickel transport system substrate-binding protein